MIFSKASMSEWIAAVELGDLNKLRTLLEQGQPVDGEDEDGYPAFQLAVCSWRGWRRRMTA